MGDGVFGEKPLVAQAAVLQLARHRLGVIGFVGALGEMPQSGTVLRTQHQDHVGVARRDRRGELGHRMLRALSADGFQHRAGGRRPDAVAHRPRIVRRTPQRCRAPAGDFELPDADHGVDGLRDGGHIGTGIGQSSGGGRGGEFDRRHAPVGRIVDAFGELTDPDDDRRPRIDRRHRPFRISRANSAVADGVLPTFTPAASSASFLAAAVPDEPDTMAPA